mmetsp:Transcript_15916/g.21050  ORF Transcript_15916/g.21050 Transcript_15916/m.21050 type:complete len:92 (+) Transcript_15916:83-358(+)
MTFCVGPGFCSFFFESWKEKKVQHIILKVFTKFQKAIDIYIMAAIHRKIQKATSTDLGIQASYVTITTLKCIFLFLTIAQVVSWLVVLALV